MGIASSGAASSLPHGSVPVYINVYDLQAQRTEDVADFQRATAAEPLSGKSNSAAQRPSINSIMGFGFYHSGVQVFESEYAFGGSGSPEGCTGSGIFASAPQSVLPPQHFFKQHLAGYLPPSVTHSDILAVISGMASRWDSSRYHIIRMNCNHFTEAFLHELSNRFCRQPPFQSPLRMPAYINRAARLGECLVPATLLNALARPGPQTSRGASSTPSFAEPKGTAPLPTDRVALEAMSVRELKAAMAAHGIDWTGCIEKSELVNRILASAHDSRPN